MTTIPTPEQAAAVRRAAAFLLHNGNRDLEGVNAVLAELCGNQEDTVRFLMGLGTVFESLLPVVYSNAGQWLVRQTVADLAGLTRAEALAWEALSIRAGTRHNVTIPLALPLPSVRHWADTILDEAQLLVGCDV